LSSADPASRGGVPGPNKDGEALMTVLEYDAPVRSSGHVEFDFSKIDPAVRKELRPLGKLDNYHAIPAVLQDFAIIAISVWLCVGVSWWFFPLSALFIGGVQRAFGHLLHESAHKVLTKNSKLNLVLGTVFSGYFILHLMNPYRNTHVGAHHRNLGDADRDPDYIFHQECGLYDPYESNVKFFTKNILLALFGFRTFTYLKYIATDRVFTKARRETVSQPIGLRTEQFLLLAEWAVIFGVAAVFGWVPYVLLFWFVPMFTTGVAVGWLSELAEHYPLPESEDKQLLMTRNRRGWFIENWIFGRHHENYHLVHHLNTGIPFWNMKRAHRVLLKDPAYAAWDQIWGGVLTRPRDRKGKETLISYASKYRDWRREGGDPRASSTTFAEVLTLAYAGPKYRSER
jgi:fatty acid desaturase